MEAILSIVMVIVIAVLSLPSQAAAAPPKALAPKSSMMSALEARFMENGWVDGNCVAR